MRRAAAIVLVGALLAGCTGGSKTGAPKPSASGTAAAARERVTKESPPPAQMQVGTNFTSGVLARYCEESRCDVDEGASPHRAVEATEQGLLLFVLRRVPASAKVEVLKQSNGRQVMHQALHTGSLTLAVHEELDPGSYVVRLNAAWHGHAAVWLFGLKVPRSRD